MKPYVQYKVFPKSRKEYWKKHFEQKTFDELLKEARNSEYVKIISSNLPKDAKIVEAGTGYGRFCQVLFDLGFKNVGGFDNNKELLEIGKKHDIKNLKYGDIRSPPYEDETIDAWVDLGVIEHFSLDDQDKILQNVHRILTPNGKIFINVPYMTNIRKLIYPYMWTKNQVRRILKGAQFYQYIYTKSQIFEIIQRNKFEIIDAYYPIHGCHIFILGKKS